MSLIGNIKLLGKNKFNFMAKIKITEAEVKRMMETGDRVRGAALKTLEEYILSKKGKEGIRMVEERLKELGCPIKFQEVAPHKWYEGSWDTLLTVVILEVFGWDESKAFDVGHDSLVVHSLTAKLLLSRFFSVEAAIKKAPKIWRYFSSLGKIDFPKYDIDKGFAVMRLEEYKKIHPAGYDYIRGVLAKIVEMLSESEDVKVEQTKSLYNQDPHDEFEITWK
jgi:hypothetical protein